MRKHIGKALALTATALLTLGAVAADKKLVLKFHDEHMRGENIISIKKEIRSQNPRINLNKFELKAVVLVAKSKKGGGKAFLQVGSERTDRQIIDGSPYDFDDSAAYTFDKLRFDDPSYNGSRGAWKMHLKGNLIVRKMIVKLDRKYGFEPTPTQPSRLRFQEVDSFTVDKFFETTDRVYVEQRNVKAIKLSAERAPVQVLSVVAVFANGNTKMLPGLTGMIFDGSHTMVKFRELKNVRSLRITAVSPNVYGSRGRLSVEVGKRR